MIKTEENKEKILNEERERERQLDTISESDRSENDILIELAVVNLNSRYTSNNFKFNLWHIPKPKNLLSVPTL